MKIGIYSTSNHYGGAAIAARRLHQALLKNNVDSVMHTGYKSVRDDKTRRYKSKFQFFNHKLFEKLENIPWKLKQKAGKQSLGIFSSISAKEINHSPYDIINLHWICDGFLSIKEIGKIKKPVIWTLHDMWSFCGTSHFPEFDQWNRWTEGYSAMNSLQRDMGIDLERWVWSRKVKYWKIPMHIVTPSNWLGECVQKSSLMKTWPVTVIPNPLDTNIFRPQNRDFDSNGFRINPKSSVILSLLPYGIRDKRKGWDLLLETIKELEKKMGENKIEVIVAGEKEPIHKTGINIPIHTTGFIKNESKLAELYNLADVTVLPSRMENLSQVAVEAQACGCPVVAFDVTGNRDLIDQNKTGYLAEPYSAVDLAEGIRMVLSDENRWEKMSENARERAVSLWSERKVVGTYVDTFQKILKGG